MEFIKNIKIEDINICDKADSFLQSAMWGHFKSRFGWQAKAFIIDWETGGEKALLVLCRRLAPGFAMAYIPWGPELPSVFPDDINLKNKAAAELAAALKPFLPAKTVFIRLDLPYPNVSRPQPPVPSPLLAAINIQPPDTVILDLELPEKDILAAMKSKWRYNIGLAEKHKIEIKHSSSVKYDYADDMEIFYRLLRETAERDGIAVHSLNYYRTLFEEAGVLRELRLYTAWHEGDALAAVIVLFRGKQATYLYGASSNVKRNLMAAYALQWRAIQDAKTWGCSDYDFFGIPPDNNPNHPMAGLYRFKTGFGGRIIHRQGSMDYPYKPVFYALFSKAERLRKKSMDKKKRQR